MKKSTVSTEPLSNPMAEPSSNGVAYPVSVPQEAHPLGDTTVEQQESRARKSVLERLREERHVAEDLEIRAGEDRVKPGKPGPMEWVRVRAGEAWCIEAFTVRPPGSEITYLVFGEALQQKLRRRKHGRDVALYTAITKRGTLFLWEVPLSRNEYHVSARQAALRAQAVWVQISSNQERKLYTWEESTKLGDPEWPQRTLEDYLDDAFGDAIIESADHEVIRELWGEM